MEFIGPIGVTRSKFRFTHEGISGVVVGGRGSWTASVTNPDTRIVEHAATRRTKIAACAAVVARVGKD